MKKILLALFVLVSMSFAFAETPWVRKYSKEGVYHIYNNKFGSTITNENYGVTVNTAKKEDKGKKIYFSKFEPWGLLIFNFTNKEDLTDLVINDYVLEMKIKSNNRSQVIQLYFTAQVDGKSYQMGKKITEEDFVPGDEWQTIRIPLKELEAWDLYDQATKTILPNQFSWDIVKQFIIQNGEQSLNFPVEFMDIRITK